MWGEEPGTQMVAVGGLYVFNICYKHKAYYLDHYCLSSKSSLKNYKMVYLYIGGTLQTYNTDSVCPFSFQAGWV